MIDSLYVVIVNWNLKDDTLTCIESLVSAGMPIQRIILVDNASSDGSVQALGERFGGALSLIESPSNVGFAQGSNLGIYYALDHAAQWILLLNNDTYVARDFLLELAQAQERGPQCAIMAPVILYHDSPDRIWYLGDRIMPGLLFTHSLYRGRKNRGDWPPLVDVDFVTGCAMLVRREVFERVGLFDPELFMYGEDVDFCWRARLAGFRLAVAPRARMWHRVSTSSNRNRQAAYYMHTLNQNRFYRRNSRGLQVPVMLLLSALRSLALALGNLVRGNATLALSLLRGWKDGWLKAVNDGNDHL